MNRSENIFVCYCACLLLAAGIGHAETVIWSDNFETNTPNRWSITSSGWNISSPSAGPATNAAGFRTHSGTNCASTQNYPAYLDSRLVCTNYNGTNVLVVTAASQFPRLRFWHWFNNQSAAGFVEISTDKGTNWNQISPTYQNTVSGVWSRPSIDLSVYAGQSLQIAFRFYGGISFQLGWYVDDVAVVTNAPAWNNPETFEFDGWVDWSVSAGTWEIGKPTSGPNTAHAGTNCAGTVLTGNYAYNVDSRLISPSFVVPASNSPALRFWHWYNFINALGFVEISTDEGANWNQISPTYQNSNTGSSWTNVSIDLSVYGGKKVKIAYHFGSGGIYTAPGWYVDDISVVVAPVLTVPQTQTIYAGQTLVVTNSATNSIFPNCTFTFGIVSASANVFINTNNGILTWTNTAPAAPSTNTISVTVSDNNSPPLGSTNNFTVIIKLPNPPQLTTSVSVTNDFQFTLNTISNTTWRIDASTNLYTWLPIFTNLVGASGTLQFSDDLATNFPCRYYRAVFQ